MFDILVGIILKNEGGYVNDPDDPGGETKYGITKQRYPNLDIRNLTREQAKEIYRTDFFIPMDVERVYNDTNSLNLALQYFDFGVNAGINRAKNLLVESLKIKQKEGGNLVSIYKDLRRQYYKDLTIKKPVMVKFLKGWLNRVDKTVIV